MFLQSLFQSVNLGARMMSRMVKVHVTYDKTKRIISHQKGSEVQPLRHVFLQVFSDVLSDQVAPANVIFQRYDDSFSDYVELNNDEKLDDDDIKLLALVSKQDKQAENSTSSAAESGNNPVHCGPHWIISQWILHNEMLPNGPSQPMFIRPHPLKQHTNYRLWNPVSRQNDSLIQRDASNNIVTCNGSFTGGNDTVIVTSGISNNLVSLIFKDTAANKQYVVTAGNKASDDITAPEVQIGSKYGDKSKFEPLYFWSYTMFRNKYFDDWYLGCDNTGKTTLVTNSSLEYPNPQALFIANKVV